MIFGRIRYKVALPALYLVIALGGWLDFARLPPDELANLGLMLVVFPVTALDLALRPADDQDHINLHARSVWLLRQSRGVLRCQRTGCRSAVVDCRSGDRSQPDGVSSWASKQIAVPKMKPQIKPFSAQPRPVTQFDYLQVAAGPVMAVAGKHRLARNLKFFQNVMFINANSRPRWDQGGIFK